GWLVPRDGVRVVSESARFRRVGLHPARAIPARRYICGTGEPLSPAAISSLVGAFLIGGIPFSPLIARLRGVDLRRVGSGKIGATNLARSFGDGIGAFGLALDAAKGAAGATLPRPLLGPDCTPLT